MLALEIEYLNRVSYASKFGTPNEPEWPPHPDRVFMALTAAWGAGGKRREEEIALRWLERQEPPEIAAPEASPRDSFRNFVPTSGNGAHGTGYLSGYILEIKDSIRRKERHFPAVVLPDDDHTVHMIWRGAEPEPGVKKALSELARKVSHVGHSASLTRVAVCDDPRHAPTHVRAKDGSVRLRCPHEGRLDALVAWFEGSQEPPTRPRAATALAYGDPDVSVPASVMGDGKEWIVLSFEGMAPVLTAFPAVAKKMRDAVMSRADGRIHEAVSGHSSDGTPTQSPHMAIVPMANVGWKESDGGLLGMALILPRISGYGTPERRQVRQAVSKFLDSGNGKGVLNMGVQSTRHGQASKDASGSEGSEFVLGRDDQSRWSLKPERYATKSKIWKSVTPVVLDHHPKRNKSPADILADACQRVRLPKPARTHTSRYASVSGVPPAYVRKEGVRGWHHPKPGFLDNKYVCHATVEFERPVRGPVMLGAGRYYGLGLFVSDGGRA